MHRWPLQIAQAQFCEVLRAAQQVPQLITRHGQEAGYVLSPEAYHALTQPQGSLVDFFRHGPLFGVELDLSRQPESACAADLPPSDPSPPAG